MSQLEAAEPSVMQTNGQGRWAVAACEETSIQKNLLNCADTSLRAEGPIAKDQKGTIVSNKLVFGTFEEKTLTILSKLSSVYDPIDKTGHVTEMPLS